MYYQINSYRARASSEGSFTPSSFYMHKPNMIFEQKGNVHYESGRVRMSFM
ncbi:hypothetical protein HOC35_01990 [Candidatus Woesearchaeota archaeon]|nr:hypothetical protein [Candidatus Woesearchaeota archaeon]